MTGDSQEVLLGQRRIQNLLLGTAGGWVVFSGASYHMHPGVLCSGGDHRTGYMAQDHEDARIMRRRLREDLGWQC